MTLEVNLVKTASIDSKMSKILARSRYQVNDDTEALDSIEKFIADNASTFNAALTDQRLVSRLSNLSNLTITELQCLRYVLASKGIDIWYWYVYDGETNAEDLAAGTFEYNVVDKDNIIGNFIPFATKFIQSTTENSLVELYNKVIRSYGLFESSKFTGMVNPLQSMVDAMKNDELALGTVSTMKTTYVNSVLDFLHKDIRVITE